MTTFHDTVLATDPIVFIAMDGPNDTSSTMRDLADTSALSNVSAVVGGTRQTAQNGPVAFGYELALDGVDDYWTGNSTLIDRLQGDVAGIDGIQSSSGYTAAIWWRTSHLGSADSTSRFFFRLWPYGIGTYRSGYAVFGIYYDTSGTSHTQSFTSAYRGETGAGWQFSVLQCNASSTFTVYRNSGAAKTTVSNALPRTGDATAFALGRDGGASSGYFGGSLGPLIIWDRTLTGREVHDMYLAGLGVAAETVPLFRRPVSRRQRTDRILISAP